MHSGSNAHGIAAFVLKYRLGPTYHNPIELGDAQRAIQTVRARATEYGIEPDHLVNVGLLRRRSPHSHGGNKVRRRPARDLTIRSSVRGSRPDFLVLAYPVITLEDPEGHVGSRKYLLGDHPDPALVAELSAEKHVTRDTPPSFLYATTDDKTVPVLNSVMFYTALVKAGVPAEMHIFESGPHGTGLAQTFPGPEGLARSACDLDAGPWLHGQAAVDGRTPHDDL